jgi:transcriptional regulator with XRE-family HTH domain/thioredoxin-like negative regulator of GroEL
MSTLGEMITALRESRGWSQGRLAAVLCELSGRDTINREHVSRWEHGRRRPGPYWLGHLATALDVPLTTLELADAGERPDPRTAAALRTAHQWLVAEPPQLTETRSGRRIGTAQARQIYQRVVELRHLDDHLPCRDLEPLAIREYAAIAKVVRDGSYGEETGRSLLTSLAEAAQISGWIESDAGHHAQAEARYLEGVQAAQEAGDRAVAANLLSCLAYQWTSLGHARDAELLAVTAAGGAGPDAAQIVRALLGERLAYARARAGDRDGAARALDQVDDAYEARSHSDMEPEWTYWLDRDEITVMAARCWTTLGQPGKAAPLIADVLTRYGQDQTREQALYWSFLAEAYLNAGQRAEAAQALATASSYAARTSSARVDQKIALLRHALSGSDGPAT